MANPEHLEILRQGVKTWNQWRRNTPGVRVDLSKADLNVVSLLDADEYFRDGADLSGANLSGANLREAILSRVIRIGPRFIPYFVVADLGGADLGGAILSKAILSKVNLRAANLRGAYFSEANLRGANLSRADLSGTDLSEADLSGVDLSGAYLRKADLYGANLSSANLNSVNLSSARLSRATLYRAIFTDANFVKANLRAADIREASLRGAKLINATLDGATLTGAYLWETQRSGWSIKGVICDYAYWDEDGKEKSIYSPGEFEKLFADKTKVRLFYRDGISPLEIATIPALIKHLEDSHPGSGLRLVGVREDSGGVVVELAIDDDNDKSSERLKRLRDEIKTTAQRAIEFERKFLAEEKIRGQLEARLDELRQWFGEQQRLLASANQFNIIGSNMGDTYNVNGQAGAIGQNAHAHDMTFNQIVSHFEQSIDLPALAKQLSELREEMAKRQDSSPQSVIAQGEAAKAEIAAKDGNASKVVEYLKVGGQGLLDIAKETGKELLAAAIKASMGMQ
jgi:uncharacterized protein YjbI with pentapeptide repeats